MRSEHSRTYLGPNDHAPSQAQREEWDEIVERKLEELHAQAVSGEDEVLCEMWLATIGAMDSKSAFDFEQKKLHYAQEFAYRKMGIWIPDYERAIW